MIRVSTHEVDAVIVTRARKTDCSTFANGNVSEAHLDEDARNAARRLEAAMSESKQARKIFNLSRM